MIPSPTKLALLAGVVMVLPPSEVFAKPTFYDQRQDGVSNIDANVEDVVFVIVPTAKLLDTGINLISMGKNNRKLIPSNEGFVRPEKSPYTVDLEKSTVPVSKIPTPEEVKEKVEQKKEVVVGSPSVKKDLKGTDKLKAEENKEKMKQTEKEKEMDKKRKELEKEKKEKELEKEKKVKELEKEKKEKELEKEKKEKELEKEKKEKELEKEKKDKELEKEKKEKETERIIKEEELEKEKKEKEAEKEKKVKEEDKKKVGQVGNILIKNFSNRIVVKSVVAEPEVEETLTLIQEGLEECGPDGHRNKEGMCVFP